MTNYLSWKFPKESITGQRVLHQKTTVLANLFHKTLRRLFKFVSWQYIDLGMIQYCLGHRYMLHIFSNFCWLGLELGFYQDLSVTCRPLYPRTSTRGNIKYVQCLGRSLLMFWKSMLIKNFIIYLIIGIFVLCDWRNRNQSNLRSGKVTRLINVTATRICRNTRCCRQERDRLAQSKLVSELVFDY